MNTFEIQIQKIFERELAVKSQTMWLLKIFSIKKCYGHIDFIKKISHLCGLKDQIVSGNINRSPKGQKQCHSGSNVQS